MDKEKFPLRPELEEVLESAENLVSSFENDMVMPQHLLYAIAEVRTCWANIFLRENYFLDPEDIRGAVCYYFGKEPIPYPEPIFGDGPNHSTKVVELMKYAQHEAESIGLEALDSRYVLLGLLNLKDSELSNIFLNISRPNEPMEFGDFRNIILSEGTSTYEYLGYPED